MLLDPAVSHLRHDFRLTCGFHRVALVSFCGLPSAISSPKSIHLNPWYTYLLLQVVFAGGRLADGTFSDAVDIFSSNRSEFVTTTSWINTTLPGGARAGLIGVSANGMRMIAVLSHYAWKRE